MSKVYVVQQALKKDERGKLVSKFDLSSAAEYGELVFLLSPNASPFNPEPIIEELHEKLEEFQQEDYLLLVGNPCLIAWAASVASQYSGGQLNLLQWHGIQRRYKDVISNVAEEKRSD